MNADDDVETLATVFPVPENQHAPQFIATINERTTLQWDGQFNPDGGTATAARFGTAHEALTAGKHHRSTHPGDGTVDVRIWPPFGAAEMRAAPWWITGQDEDGESGLAPGSWPFMVCRAGYHPGTWEAVCMDVQSAVDAHLIAAAPALQHALRQAVLTMAAMRDCLRTCQSEDPDSIESVERAHAATEHQAEHAIAAAQGRVIPKAAAIETTPTAPPAPTASKAGPQSTA